MREPRTFYAFTFGTECIAGEAVVTCDVKLMTEHPQLRNLWMIEDIGAAACGTVAEAFQVAQIIRDEDQAIRDLRG